MPNAKVTSRNVGTNATNEARTDSNGLYRITNLTPGEYVLSAEVTGFRKIETQPQRLTIGTAMRQDFTLELGTVSEVVEVSGSAPQVNTDNAQLGVSITEIPNLPNISGAGGRNPLNLVGLVPGVNMAVTGAQGNAGGAVGGFSVNGQRTQANNYVLDGVDSNDLAINVPDALGQISPNALGEFRVVTGAMKAEYGRNGGAVIEAITKSGSNEFHGAATEVFRNTVLNATPFFQNVSPGGAPGFAANGLKRKPQWNTNDYDAQFGGPIFKNKTFFFINYLGFRRRQGVTSTATVPNASERAILVANAVPSAKALLDLVPAASTGSSLITAPSNSLDRDQGLVKIDQRFGDKNALAFTYFIEKQRAFDPFAFGGSTIPGFGTLGETAFTNYVLRDTHTFSANVVNEARVGFHRRAQPGVLPVNHTTPQSLGFNLHPDDAVNAGPPWVIVAGLSSWGNTIQGPQARFDNTWQYIDSINWTKGRHGFKFGGDYRAYEQNQQFTFVNNGYYQFDGSGTQEGFFPKIAGLTDALNDFAHGFATVYVQNSAARQGYRDRFSSLFFQDDWKVRPNFTLNLGVRWEYAAPLTELHDRLNAFRPGQQSTVFPDAPVGLVFPGDKGISRSTYDHDWNNFGPRVGFAWDPKGNGKMSVRGGYGIFYDVPVSELTLQFLTAPPFGIQPNIYYVDDIRNPYTTSQINPIKDPFPFTPIARGGHFDFTSIAPIGLTVMDPNFATPYSQQWNLQLQYQLGNDWMFSSTYVGTLGTKLLNRKEINYGLVNASANSGNIDERRLFNITNPQAPAYGGFVFGGITDQSTDANSNYHALQIYVEKRYSHGLTMTHAYTWSHAIDDASGLRVASNPFNARLDRGNSEFDVRHRYAGSAIYELPWLKGNHSALGMIAGGWRITSLLTFQTGVPFDITEPQDRCLCSAGTQRPDYIGGEVTFLDPRNNTLGKQNTYFDGTGGGSATGSPNPFFRRVGTGAAASQGAGRFGTLGRNVFHGPGIATVDLGVSKIFNITERHKIELRGEGFNIANHTNFNNPAGTTGASIGSTSFGRITTAKDPRLIQLTLRYMF